MSIDISNSLSFKGVERLYEIYKDVASPNDFMAVVIHYDSANVGVRSAYKVNLSPEQLSDTDVVAESLKNQGVMKNSSSKLSGLYDLSAKDWKTAKVEINTEAIQNHVARAEL
ncbi:MAG: hypothetical protein CMH26_09910 [Micavibrio sp.]|nr:hypothetical protein [Micavibrio sp.]